MTAGDGLSPAVRVTDAAGGDQALSVPAEPGPGASLRLATWNCCRGPLDAKLRAAETLGADVLVIQELPRPAGRVPFIWFPVRPSLGVAVIARNGFSARRARLPRPLLGAHAVDVSGPVSFRLLAVWTRAEHRYVQSLAGDLDTLKASRSRRPVVLAGDFNSNSIWDRPGRPFDHGRLVRRLRDQLGVVSAYHAWHGVAHGAEPHATHYFLRKRERPYHLDYCFVPESWPIRGVSVGGEGAWAGLSDHRPVVVDLDV